MKVNIIGGGIIGMSSAYHLAKGGASVTVYEKDLSYSEASFARSCGGFRSQFTTATNVRMSNYSIDFIRNHTDVKWTPNGYLMMFDKEQREDAIKALNTQRDNGADQIFLESWEVAQRFPYVNHERFSCGITSVNGNEGWVDPGELHSWFRNQCRELGINLIRADGVRDTFHDDADIVVITAGWETGKVASNWGIEIPVKGHKHTCFNVKTSKDVIKDMPLVADMPGGIYLRPEGEGYIIGSELNGEWDADDLEPNYNSWETVWEAAYNLMPNIFDEAKMEGAWAGYYDASTLDNNAIIDSRGRYVIASGFTGRGLMHSPAVGLAVSELVLDQDLTFDLTEYMLDRKPNKEKYVI